MLQTHSVLGVDQEMHLMDDDELVSRICGLTHQLGYNRAKTKMLLGQWAGNFRGLEAYLLNELEAPCRKGL